MGTREIFELLRGGIYDHPHAYGDKRLFLRAVTLSRGSSPRVWGQGEGNAKYIDHDRIIPTRMGTRTVATVIDDRARDHPHAYGDKAHMMYYLPKQLGSSPRVWGQVYGRDSF